MRLVVPLSVGALVFLSLAVAEEAPETGTVELAEAIVFTRSDSQELAQRVAALDRDSVARLIEALRERTATLGDDWPYAAMWPSRSVHLGPAWTVVTATPIYLSGVEMERVFEGKRLDLAKLNVIEPSFARQLTASPGACADIGGLREVHVPAGGSSRLFAGSESQYVADWEKTSDGYRPVVFSMMVGFRCRVSVAAEAPHPVTVEGVFTTPVPMERLEVSLEGKPETIHLLEVGVQPFKKTIRVSPQGEYAVVGVPLPPYESVDSDVDTYPHRLLVLRFQPRTADALFPIRSAPPEDQPSDGVPKEPHPGR